MKVVICTPTMEKPHPAYVEAFGASIPALDAAGFEHSYLAEIGCPYISGARCTMLGKALRWGADKIVFIDDDVSWRPEDLVRLIQSDGDVVGGTYRFKCDEEKYMGKPFVGDTGRPMVRADGSIHMHCLPAGFLCITRDLVSRMADRFPWLVIRSDDGIRNIDLFNHGAYNGVWFGEDYAFSRRLIEMGVDLWCPPDMDLDHNARDGRVFKGNYHRFLSTPVKLAA